MNALPVDLPYLRETLNELAARLREAWEVSSRARHDVDAPGLLSDAMSQLIDMLDHIETDDCGRPLDAGEINTLSEYGLHLLDELTQVAGGLDQTGLAQEIEHLSLPYALWIVRHGGEIRHLGPVVNALARHANQHNRPDEMANLYVQCCELIEAINPALEEVAATDPSHPLRLLLLNRAIVATRSHKPELIEPAFDAVVEHLPNDARQFFAEAMEQMTVIDYPDTVRDLVRRYFLLHAVPGQLH